MKYQLRRKKKLEKISQILGYSIYIDMNSRLYQGSQLQQVDLESARIFMERAFKNSDLIRDLKSVVNEESK